MTAHPPDDDAPTYGAALSTVLQSWSPRQTLRGNEGNATLAPPAETLVPRPELALVGDVDQVRLTWGDLLGKGGMGKVVAAMQHSLGREVAVKVVRPDWPAAVAGLLREARVAGRLEHPGIVPVHALCDSPEGPVLVMKRIEGAQWSELLDDPDSGPWEGRSNDPLDRHLQVFVDVCHAVELAHSKGVIHRDIKPDNVMVGPFGEVYLLDWGVAFMRSEHDDTGQDRMVGTPAYMAPEMTGVGRTDTPTTDVFLLGATLHEVLTGLPRHVAGSTLEALDKARRAQPATYDELVPPALGDIANTACARDPRDRYASVALLRGAVEQYRAHRSSLAASDQATRELVALEALLDEAGQGDDAEEAHLAIVRRFSAARFGFAQALREWPENPRARHGLEMAVDAMVRYELERGDPGAAAALLAETQTPDPALLEQVAAASAQQQALLDAGARMAELSDELRVAGTDWGRSLITLLSGVVGALLLVGMGTAMRTAGGEVGGGTFALGALLGLLANLVGLAFSRRQLLDNRASFRLMIVLTTIWALGILVGLGGVLISAGWSTLMLGFCAVVIAICFTLAVTFDRLFFVSGSLAVAVSAMALWRIDYGIDIVGLGYLLHSFWYAWVLRPGAKGPSSASGPAMWGR